MSVVEKPSVDPRWARNNNPADNIEPTTALKDNGVLDGGIWGREHLNWQMSAISQWIDWVRSSTTDRFLNLSDLTEKPTARTNLGATTVGNALFTAASAATARVTLGVGAAGRDIFISATQKDAMRAALPVNFVYTQYPGEGTPANLFGGTWTLLFNTEGIFFRTEGGNASAFGSGIQSDMIKEHQHELRKAFAAGGGGEAATNWSTSGSVLSPGSGPFGGAETRPRNRTIRIWRKTSNTDA